MPLDLTGITNHNEYYSQHYLLALLEGDLKDVLSRWEQTASEHPDSEAHRPPPAKFRSLSSPYFRLHNRLSRLREPEARLGEQTRWLAEWLTALGYPPGTIMAICADARKQFGRAPYEALKAEGLIRDVSDALREPSTV